MRSWARVGTAAVAVAFAGILSPACAHGDAGLFIRHVMAPPVPTTNAPCEYLPDPTQPYLTSGNVDAAIASAYTPVLLVGNQLQPRASVEEGRVETSRITIQGAVVRVVDPADGSTQMNNTVLASATVDPGGGTTPGWAFVGLTLLDADALAHFDPGTTGAPSKLAVVNIRVFGRTLGGRDVESNELQFPVYVCHGCLVTYPPTAGATGYCSGSATTGSTSTSDRSRACQPGQDQVTDCVYCYPKPVCNPPKT